MSWVYRFEFRDNVPGEEGWEAEQPLLRALSWSQTEPAEPRVTGGAGKLQQPVLAAEEACWGHEAGWVPRGTG